MRYCEPKWYNYIVRKFLKPKLIAKALILVAAIMLIASSLFPFLFL